MTGELIDWTIGACVFRRSKFKLPVRGFLPILGWSTEKKSIVFTGRGHLGVDRKQGMRHTVYPIPYTHHIGMYAVGVVWRESRELNKNMHTRTQTGAPKDNVHAHILVHTRSQETDQPNRSLLLFFFTRAHDD